MESVLDIQRLKVLKTSNYRIDLEWYKKVDGKEVVVDSNDEMDEIRRKEEEAFAQALGYAAPPPVKKSVPKVSTEELKQVITATNSNYNDDQGGIGYSTATLKDFKDSIKDHLQVPVDNGKKNVYSSNQEISESKKGFSREDDRLKRSRRSDRRSPSPIEDRSRRDRRRSPSPIEDRSTRNRRRSPSPTEDRSRRDRRRSPSPTEDRSRRDRRRSPKYRRSPSPRSRGGSHYSRRY
jgi:hypothetical protein